MKATMAKMNSRYYMCLAILFLLALACHVPIGTPSLVVPYLVQTAIVQTISAQGEQPPPITQTAVIPLTQIAVVTTSPVYFNLEYEGIHTCLGYGGIAFLLQNIGNESFESGYIQIIEVDNNTRPFTGQMSNKIFGTDPCSSPQDSQNSLPPGSMAYIRVPLAIGVNMPPSGRKMRCDIKLCTQDGLDGNCYDQSLEFTIE